MKDSTEEQTSSETPAVRRLRREVAEARANRERQALNLLPALILKAQNLLKNGNPFEMAGTEMFLDMVSDHHPNLYCKSPSPQRPKYDCPRIDWTRLLSLVTSPTLLTLPRWERSLRIIRRHSEQPPMSEEEFTKQSKRLKEMVKEGYVKDEDFMKVSQAYKDLFLPCEKKFQDAMTFLESFRRGSPGLMFSISEIFSDQREEILTEPVLDCCCTTTENVKPAESFRLTTQGRLENVSKRITQALAALEASDTEDEWFWQFFLDRVWEVAPEMLDED